MKKTAKIHNRTYAFVRKVLLENNVNLNKKGGANNVKVPDIYRTYILSLPKMSERIAEVLTRDIKKNYDVDVKPNTIIKIYKTKEGKKNDA